MAQLNTTPKDVFQERFQLWQDCWESVRISKGTALKEIRV